VRRGKSRPPVRVPGIHRFAEDTDAAYPIAASVEADIGLSLEALIAEFTTNPLPARESDAKIRELLAAELKAGENDVGVPLKPQRIVSDIRKAMGDEDIVLVDDTGAVKMCAHAPASSMAKRSLAMTTALPRSISSVTTALTSASSSGIGPISSRKQAKPFLPCSPKRHRAQTLIPRPPSWG
jgi:thiamine pyrophosphate-dependent acetolactate synthase large subunit-like protein